MTKIRASGAAVLFGFAASSLTVGACSDGTAPVVNEAETGRMLSSPGIVASEGVASSERRVISGTLSKPVVTATTGAHRLTGGVTSIGQ